MLKIKHARTADCVVAGFRWHKSGQGRSVGSLLLGLYDDHGTLQHVGVTSAFTMAMRRELVASSSRCARTRSTTIPWREWAERRRRCATAHAGRPKPVERREGLSWEPLRIERVCEVKHTTTCRAALPARDDLPALAARQARHSAATISSKSRRRTSWRRCSARRADATTAARLHRRATDHVPHTLSFRRRRSHRRWNRIVDFRPPKPRALRGFEAS